MVAASMKLLRLMQLWVCIFYGVCWLCCGCCCVASSSSQPMCHCPSPHSKAPPFLTALLSQCHVSSHPNSPLEIDGDFLERALSSKSGDIYTAVLFYASWCPFSRNARSTFEVLGSIYPQIDHFAVEQSSAMPSLFSRYGIHSLPAILIVGQSSRTRFRGSKDLDSLIKFYKKTTGHEPVQYVAGDQPGSSGSGGKSILISWSGFSAKEISGKSILISWSGFSAKEIWKREPYLSFSLLFLSMRVLVYLFPTVLLYLRTLWVSFRPHLNLGIFGETSQILGRILHLIDVQRVWTKVRLCKSRNFHQGARNARVLASSLASVSLGETSTPRL